MTPLNYCVINGFECNVRFMNETNFDWDDLRLFLAVARKGGLAAAAESTGKSAPTLGRRMLALEQQLGHELFRRLPRGYELTEQGETLAKTASAVEHGISPVTNALSGTPIRRVKISAGTWVTQLLTQRVSELIHDTSVVLQFLAADHPLDIGHREAVIGIRNHRPTEISIAGRQTNNIRFAVYAVDKQVETWACVMTATPSARWVRENMGAAPCIEVNHSRNALDLALAGAAKTVLPTFVGEKIKTLKQISPPIEELEHVQWLVSHHEDRHLPEVRQLIDRIYGILISI